MITSDGQSLSMTAVTNLQWRPKFFEKTVKGEEILTFGLVPIWSKRPNFGSKNSNAKVGVLLISYEKLKVRITQSVSYY